MSNIFYAYFIACTVSLFYSIFIQAENVLIPSIPDTIKPTADFYEEVWNKATIFTEFASLKNGDVPSVKTKLYLMHNKDNLYVGFECFGQDSNKLVINSQYLQGGDSVAFALDSFNDGLAAYVFWSNPNGNRLNGTLSEGSTKVHFSFNTEYTAISKHTPNGYNVVMIIPFKSFPYYWQPSTLMRFRVLRFIHQHKEIDGYPYIMENQQGGTFPQYQTIQLDNISREEYSAPWFDADAIYHNRKRFAEGYDLNTLTGRAMGWGINDSSVADYKILPYHTLYASKNPKPLQENLKTKWVEQQLNGISFYPNRKIHDLDQFLKRTQTTSFIVVHDDKIIYEKYFNGFSQTSIAPAFSMTKSFLSALIGIAVDKKQIHSIDDSITNYLPELLVRDKRFARITIKDLLSMSTGIRAINEAPYYDDARAYWSPDLKHVLLNTLAVIEPPGRHFNYHDYFAQLAGLILVRATHQTATQLLQNELWNPLGMQYGGSWSIDSEKDDLEQLAVGINTPAINYAKFGLLFLHEGKWDNRQIVPSSWVRESTQPIPHNLDYYPEDWSGYYKYYWWGRERTGKKKDNNDFMAVGHRGQFIYISPQKNLVVVRTGMDLGVINWGKIFYDFASKFHN